MKNNKALLLPTPGVNDSTKILVSSWRPPEKETHLRKNLNKVHALVSGTQAFKPMMGNRSKLMNFVGKVQRVPVSIRNDLYRQSIGYNGRIFYGDSVHLRVYNVEDLTQSLFSVGQFCDSDLEVASSLKHTCLFRDTRSSHQPKSENTNYGSSSYPSHGTCGPIESPDIKGKKYILVIAGRLFKIHIALQAYLSSKSVRELPQNGVVERRNRNTDGSMHYNDDILESSHGYYGQKL
ncbi:hypothetical protein Tco_0204407 [Tanacetum coccineum]